MTKVILIVGPTGIGKTEIGVRFAQKFNGEIVNADSRQVYKELDIGTSRPPPELFKKVPHHLFGVCDLNKRWDAAQFQKEADRAISEITSRKKIPIVVGGTGLYLKVLLFGLFEGPAAQPDVRQELEGTIQDEGLGRLYEELKEIDPKAATQIHPNDPTRIIRALEVYKVTGKPISNHQEEHHFKKPRYDYLKLGINQDRNILHKNIGNRVDEMVKGGLEEEVKELVRKWKRNFLLLHAIGYKEWFPYFDGEITKDQVIEQIKTNTRQFAKRQITWFRKEKDVVWVEPGDIGKMERLIKNFL